MKVAIVGAGLSGATVAHLLKDYHDVTVFEKRSHVGGMAYTYEDPDTGITIHAYGPHIFHTKSARVRRFVENFGEWVPFDLRTKTNVGGNIFSGPPINLATLNKFWVTELTPEEASERLDRVTAPYKRAQYPNFEAAALAKVGPDLYEVFLKRYTEKQWGLPCTQIPAAVLARLAIGTSYYDGRFQNEWQAIPRLGYTRIVQNMLRDVDVRLDSEAACYNCEDFDHTFWTAPLDEFYRYSAGRLPYRTLEFQTTYVNSVDAQGTPIMVYPGDEQITRVTEHKHFMPWIASTPGTIITTEIPRECGVGNIPFYPVETSTYNPVLSCYRNQALTETKVTFLGRLGTFKYLNMDQAVLQALEAAQLFLSRSL